MLSHPVLILVGVAVVAIAAILVYRNNQKRVDSVIGAATGKLPGDTNGVTPPEKL